MPHASHDIFNSVSVNDARQLGDALEHSRLKGLDLSFNVLGSDPVVWQETRAMLSFSLALFSFIWRISIGTENDIAARI